MKDQRFRQQFNFIIEIDKLKSIARQTLIVDGSRRENSAEHSWHLALMAILMLEHVDGGELDILKVVKMLLVHDIVEIDAGDVFAYEENDQERETREDKAAKRLFYLLPSDQAEELHQLWVEFEARQTPEAKWAASLDRLLPLAQNYATGGYTWKKYHISRDKVIQRNQVIQESSTRLWKYAQSIIDEASTRGYFSR
ncbi:HD domain-containing protein [Syntrophomonas erecta]